MPIPRALLESTPSCWGPPLASRRVCPALHHAQQLSRRRQPAQLTRDLRPCLGPTCPHSPAARRPLAMPPTDRPPQLAGCRPRLLGQKAFRSPRLPCSNTNRACPQVRLWARNTPEDSTRRSAARLVRTERPCTTANAAVQCGGNTLRAYSPRGIAQKNSKSHATCKSGTFGSRAGKKGGEKKKKNCVDRDSSWAASYSGELNGVPSMRKPRSKTAGKCPQFSLDTRAIRRPGEGTGPDASGIPHNGFGRVEADVRLTEQVVLKHV